MEQKINSGAKVRDLETGEIYTVCNAIETNNQWGYGTYIYQFKETIDAEPCFGLYRKEFELI